MRRPLEEDFSESAYRRDGTTNLSVAVRSRAPRHVIQELLDANFDQVGFIHPSRGTILHEAFKCRLEEGALDVLVHAAVHYDHQRPSQMMSPLLGVKDELGRTALHYLIDRIVRGFDRGESTSGSCWNLLRLMVEYCPSTVGTVDADGNTPLVLLLLVSAFDIDDRRGRQCEEQIFHLVRFMVERCPNAVNVGRRLPRPWHYHFQYEKNDDSTHDRQQCLSSLIHGDGVPSPLSCAILQSRSLDTLRVLMKADRHLDARACNGMVTHHREVPLHIAVSMRAPAVILKNLVDEEPRMVRVPDICGLLPLDWAWIRYTIDSCSVSNGCLPPVASSRRRHISTNFLEWHERVSNQYLGITKSVEPSNLDLVNWKRTRELHLDLLTKISHLLPVMARQDLFDESSMMQDDGDDDTVLHAACAVNCPLALVALLCDTYQDHIGTRDVKMRRLPLHYAASRKGYTAQFPIGGNNQLQGMEEVSPVNLVLAKFPSACRVVDGQNQLPLHIAIDHAKEEGQRRRSCRRRSLDASSSTTSAATTGQQSGNRSFYRPVDAILSHYPEALHRRDGLTKLYPFQQAAAGQDGDAELCYLLLRRDPTLIASDTMNNITSSATSLVVCEQPWFTGNK